MEGSDILQRTYINYDEQSIERIAEQLGRVAERYDCSKVFSVIPSRFEKIFINIKEGDHIMKPDVITRRGYFGNVSMFTTARKAVAA